MALPYFGVRTAQEHVDRERMKQERQAQMRRDADAEAFRQNAARKMESLSRVFGHSEATKFGQVAQQRLQQLNGTWEALEFQRAIAPRLESFRQKVNERDADLFKQNAMERLGRLQQTVMATPSLRGDAEPQPSALPGPDIEALRREAAAKISGGGFGNIASGASDVAEGVSDRIQTFGENATSGVGHLLTPPRVVGQPDTEINYGGRDTPRVLQSQTTGLGEVMTPTVTEEEVLNALNPLPLPQSIKEETARQVSFLSSPAGVAGVGVDVATAGAGSAALQAGSGFALGALGREAELQGIDPRLKVGPLDIGLRGAGEVLGPAVGAMAAPRLGRGVSSLATGPDDITVGPGTFPGPDEGLDLAAPNRIVTPEEPPFVESIPPKPPKPPALEPTDDWHARVSQQFERAAPKSVDAWDAQIEDWHRIRTERTAAMATRREELISQGVMPDIAIDIASTELRGKMPIVKVALGLDLDPLDEARLWDRAINMWGGPREFKLKRLQVAFKEVAGLGDAPARNFKPNEWDLIEELMGREFRVRAQQASKLRSAALDVRKARGDAERMAASVNRPLGPRPDYPPEWGGEQGAFTRNTPVGTEPLPVPDYWATEQFRTQMRLGESAPSTPIGRTLGDIPPERGASPTLPGINAPTSRAADVLPPEASSSFWTMAADSLGIPRGLMSGFDLSNLRQLSKSVVRHPFLTKETAVINVKAMNPKGGEQFAINLMETLRNEGVGTNVGYRQVVKTADGATREIGLGKLIEDRLMSVPGTPEFKASSVMERPEFFMSRRISRMPGARSFAAGWNHQYSGVSRDLLSRFTKMNGGALSEKQVGAALTFVERLLGKGTLGPKGGENWFAKALKVLGFAPGYRASGPEAFATLISPFTDNNLRRLAAEELLTWTTAGSLLMTAAAYGAGATVVTTLGSSQFGRMKFPGSDTYYNIWGTDNVLARAIIQAAVQQKIDTQGNVRNLGNQEGGVPGFLTAAKDVTWDYLKSGQDPIVGLITELSSGETYMGEPLKWDAESAWRVVSDRMPMIGNELWDIYSTDGPFQTILSVPGSVFGLAGSTSYTPTGEKFKAIPTYNTASLDVTRKYLPGAPEPLNLTANEEREIRDFIGREGPVQEWKQAQEREFGPAPEGVTMDNIIKFVAKQEGWDDRMTAGALFMYHASGDLEAYNPEWVEFGLTHEDDLKDRFPGTFNTAAMDTFRQRAREQGLVK